jgi:hypothetical protein
MNVWKGAALGLAVANVALIGVTLNFEARITALESRIVGATPEGWHRRDMKEWVECSQGEYCDPYALPGYLDRIDGH